MRVTEKFLKGAIQTGLGQVGQQLLLFLRNVLIARLLPQEQFGIALTLVTVIGAVDAITEIGIEIFLIRSREEAGDERLQSTLHMILIVRGAAASGLLFALAGPISQLFHVPESAWIYQILAIIPALRGFVHLDIRRFEKALRYWPGICINFAAIAAGTIAAFCFALWLKDARSLLFAQIIQTFLLVAGSHVLSSRPYRTSYDAEYIRKLSTFGAPLILNGVLLFLIFQGDRILIGAKLGLRELAVYGSVSLLTVGVTMLVTKVFGQLYLPVLTGFDRGELVYERRYEKCGALSLVVALSSLLGFAIAGEEIVTAAFGSAYGQTDQLVTWLGFHCACRIFRSWPQIGQLASGNTKALLQTNILSSLGMPSAFLAVEMGWGLTGIAACYAVSEFISMLYATLLWRAKWTSYPMDRFVYIFVFFASAVLAMEYYGFIPVDAWVRVFMLVIGLAGILFAALWASPALRHQMLKTLLSRLS